MNTIVEWPSEKKKPTLIGRLPSAHQLARGVVDRRDVIGVEGVTQAERVGGHADPDRERSRRTELVVVRRDDGDQEKEADRMQPDHDRGHNRNRAPLR